MTKNTAPEGGGGDGEEERRMLEAHAPLVTSVVARFWGRGSRAHGLEWDDLFQAGMVGLLLAIRRYDPATGCEFSTLAVHYVRGGVLEEIRRRTDLIRVPSYLTGEERQRLRSLLRPGRLNRDLTHADAGWEVDEDAPPPGKAAEDRDEAGRLLGLLTAREAEAVRATIMGGELLDDVAARWGTTRSYVQQVRAQALGRMRRAAAAGEGE